MVFAARPLMALALFFVVASSVSLLRTDQQEGKGGKALAAGKDGEKSPTAAILATLGLIYGVSSVGYTSYKIVDAEKHKEAFSAGLAKAIEYSESTGNNKDTNNMAMLTFAKAYEHCELLRPEVGRAWATVYRKREALLNKKKEEPRAEEPEGKEGKKGIDIAKKAHAATGIILSGAELAAEIVDAAIKAASEVASASHAVVGVDPLVGILVGSAALALKNNGIFLHKEFTAKHKADNSWWSTAFGRAGSAVGITGSIIAACFDPTGLSILSIVVGLASTAGQETMIWQERTNWAEHYCPALDKAFYPSQQNRPKFHYGPIVNNRDCEERLDQNSCGLVQNKGCVWNGNGLVKSVYIKGGLTYIKGDRSVIDKGCSGCPYMYKAPALSTNQQLETCEGHTAPNGKRCVYARGMMGNTVTSQCCAQSRNKVEKAYNPTPVGYRHISDVAEKVTDKKKAGEADEYVWGKGRLCYG